MINPTAAPHDHISKTLLITAFLRSDMEAAYMKYETIMHDLQSSFIMEKEQAEYLAVGKKQRFLLSNR